MIKFLSSWAEQIVIVMIVSTIIELILPKNKIKKYVQTLIGIYIIFAIISPILNSNNISIGNVEQYLNQIIDSSKTTNQTSVDNRLQDLYIQEITKNVTEQIELQGYTVLKCEVDANLQDGEKQGINKIKVKISNTKKENTNQILKVDEINIKINEQINENEITKDEIVNLKKYISEFYQIEENKININY